MDDIIEHFVGNTLFCETWYAMNDQEQIKFKNELKEIILCQVYRHLDKYM